MADFKVMIKNEKEDQVEEAIDQMKSMIRRLVEESLLGDSYPKARECLEALR